MGVDGPASVRADSEREPAILFVGTWEGGKRRHLHRILTEQVRPRLAAAELWMVSDHCEHRPGAGWFPRPSDVELERLYDCARAFCLRRSNEGLGIQYIEAMARDTPVVAAPGFRLDFVLDGAPCGLTARESGLGSALHAVLNDVRLRDRLVQHRRRRAAAFSSDRLVDFHEGAYRDAISAWRSEYART